MDLCAHMHEPHSVLARACQSFSMPLTREVGRKREQPVRQVQTCTGMQACVLPQAIGANFDCCGVLVDTTNLSQHRRACVFRTVLGIYSVIENWHRILQCIYDVRR